MKIKLYKENFAILFHHFHKNNMFYDSPGSLTNNKFEKFVKKNRSKLTDADDFLDNFKKKKKLISLSFDDGLKCQFEIALPILEKEKIKAFFFIPTSNFEKNKLSAEITRYFKYKYFKNINKFNNSFLKYYNKFSNNPLKISKLNNKLFIKIKKESPYYKKADIEHKIIRDHLISDKHYNKIILLMIKEKKINLNSLKKKLLMSKRDINKILKLGHVIGLHSHSHSYKFHNLKYTQEYREYKKNKLYLEKIINKSINVASYPFGYQTKNSIKILKKFGIQFAFNKNFIKKNKKNLSFNISRENISNIIN